MHTGDKGCAIGAYLPCRMDGEFLAYNAFRMDNRMGSIPTVSCVVCPVAQSPLPTLWMIHDCNGGNGMVLRSVSAAVRAQGAY